MSESGGILERENKLWADCKSGDLNARAELIVAYRPLVFWFAGKLKVSPSLRQDLIQDGMLALICAVDRFDPARELRFTTYASYRIRGQMLNMLERKEKRAPMPIDFDELDELGELDGSGGSESIGARPDEAWGDVAESIAKLRGKEAAVVSAIFFDGKEPSDVAKEQNMDVSSVYRLRRSAIVRIREWLGLPLEVC
ncbi:flagellar biosynthesis protein FliA [Synergistales bacterium]|nr:flagellar biosynthesis protein FliA [Synergistales bacterium]